MDSGGKGVNEDEIKFHLFLFVTALRELSKAKIDAMHCAYNICKMHDEHNTGAIKEKLGMTFM